MNPRTKNFLPKRPLALEFLVELFLAEVYPTLPHCQFAPHEKIAAVFDYYQINLHHCRYASAMITVIAGGSGNMICLIQELYLVAGRVLRPKIWLCTNRGKSMYCNRERCYSMVSSPILEQGHLYDSGRESNQPTPSRLLCIH